MDINKYNAKGRISVRGVGLPTDLSEADVYEVLWLAKKIKRRQSMKERLDAFCGKNVLVMLGSKNSLKRISYELAVDRLGGKTLYLSPDDSVFVDGLTRTDAMRAIGRFGAVGMILRSEEPLGRNTPLPYINLCGNPDVCNVLSDLLTIWEKFSRLAGLKVQFVGDGEALNAYEAETYCKCGMTASVLCRREQKPTAEILHTASQFGDVQVIHDITQAKEADVVISVAGNKPYMKVTAELMEMLPAAQYLHALPVRHGEEADESVISGERSLVFEQAENLVYVEEALMSLLFAEEMFK